MPAAGSGTTATTIAVTLSAGVPAANLYPGGSANVVLTVSNPNTSTVHISSLSLDTTRGPAASPSTPATPVVRCSVLSFTTQTNGGAGWNVPAEGRLPSTAPCR